MKGILGDLQAFETAGPWRIIHWSQAEELRADEAAWAEVWKRVRPVIAWQVWPEELARDWLGIDGPPPPPPLPENVRLLLQKTRPLLNLHR